MRRRRSRIGATVAGLVAGFATALVLAAPAAALPPGYAYEMVSPPDKNGGEVWGGGVKFGYRASADGEFIAYGSDGLFAGLPVGNGWNPYFARRGPEGWANTSPGTVLPHAYPSDWIFSPMAPSGIQPYRISEDGRLSVVGTNLSPESGALTYNRLYILDAYAGTQEVLAEPLDPTERVEIFPVPGISATDDFDVIYFTSRQQLTQDATSGQLNLYRRQNGNVELVSSTLSGDPAPGTPAQGWSELRAEPRNTVSADGEVIYYYRSDTGLQQPLYRVEDGTAASVLVNESENATPDGGAVLGGASADGELAVFIGTEHLTPDAEGGDNLFLYEHSADPENDQNLSLLSVDGEPADATALNVTEVLGVSDDAETVFFRTSGKQLVAGEPIGGGPKIFRWRQGEGLSYIATAQRPQVASSVVTSGLTLDGRFFWFTSQTQGITADDTAGLAQVYVFDGADDSITCASCIPGEESTRAATTGESLNTMEFGPEPRRWMSGDGRMFFETAEALIPEYDTNGAVDVYTWKNGQLDLISSGRSPAASRFGDASVDGTTAFFHTKERLSDWDVDEANDVYAARLGGGLPGPTIRPEEPCQGDDCQKNHGSSPTIPEIGSSTVKGESSSVQRRDCARLARRARQVAKRSTQIRRTARRLQRRAQPATGRVAVRAAKRNRKLARRAGRLQKRQVALQRRVRACRRQES